VARTGLGPGRGSESVTSIPVQSAAMSVDVLDGPRLDGRDRDRGGRGCSFQMIASIRTMVGLSKWGSELTLMLPLPSRVEDF
jgi:hypothetical protein